MKNQPVFSNSGTLEDMVFESRNKAYGAYEMNRKSRKYLVFAFLISMIGASSAVAVPLIKAFKSEGEVINLKTGGIAELSDIKDDFDPHIVLPPPPPAEVIKGVAYVAPVVVEDAPDFEGIIINEDLLATIKNSPVDTFALEIEKPAGPTGIDEKPEEFILFPQEKATFMGGSIEDFRIWVIGNIQYPAEAAELSIFGKVIVEFCVNAKGKVVDIKFIRSLDPLVDNEVLRVLSSSPDWVPAKQGGRPVKTRFTIPVLFKVQ